MEIIERQRQAVSQSIATLLKEWEEQLREKFEECESLKQDVKTLNDILEARDHTITQLRSTNAHLEDELARLQTTPGQDDSPNLKALIEKHNDLYKEHELLKTTAAANQRYLVKQLRKEREKLRGWNRFSSPGPLPAYLPMASTPGTGQRQLGPTEGEEVRTSFSGGEDHAGGSSYVQGDVFQRPSGFVVTETKQLPNEPNQGENHDGQRSSTDDLQKNVEGANALTLVEQLGKATDLSSSFVDAYPLFEPRIPSPELPSMSERHHSLLSATKADFSADREKAVSQGSLPQIQRSGSTAPPSEGLASDQMEECFVSHTPDSDIPQFLGARSTRKKTSREVPATGHVSTGSVTEPVTIKSDPDTSFASPKSARLSRLASSAYENLDPLMSVPEHTSPRKRRPPPLLPNEAARESRPKLQCYTSQRATSEPLVRKEPSPLIAQPSNGRKTAGCHAQQATPLRQIDANARNRPKNAENLSGVKTRKRKYDDRRGVQAIPAISEDGEEFFDKKAEKTSRGQTYSPQTTNSSVHQRLGNLLAEASGQKPILMPIPKKDIEEMKECLLAGVVSCTLSSKRSFEALLESENKDLEWWNEARKLLDSNNLRSPITPSWHPRKAQQREVRKAQPARTPTSASTSKATNKSNPRPPHPYTPTPIHASHRPYRTLPLSSLNLSHFKLNPSANHNLTYAYTDVVRNQSERRCLPGCTRPKCCGEKFAALAQTLPQTPTQASATSDEAVLKSYLGPTHYSTLTPAQRADHLLAARTSHLANKYGKAHRALHQRAPSPPGFWNVDFPATQEREEERRAAAEMERDEVERRWRESMKNPDPRDKGEEGRERNGAHGRADMGLWMFADE